MNYKESTNFGCKANQLQLWRVSTIAMPQVCLYFFLVRKRGHNSRHIKRVVEI